MPLTYTLTPPVITLTTVGDVDYAPGLQVTEAALKAAHASPERPPGGWSLLFDIRESTENRRSGELSGIASLIQCHRAVLSGRGAVVVAGALHFGLGRMFSAFMENYGLHIEVFTDLAEAQRWLAPRSPQPAGAKRA